MKAIVLSFALAMPVAAIASVPAPKGSPEQRAAFEAGQKQQSDFERKLLTEAAFEPAESIAGDQRAAWQMLLEDPYRMLAIPGVQIEKKPSGSAVIRIVGRSGASPAGTITAQEWEHLVSLEQDIFKPRGYVPWIPPAPGTKPPPPPPICHAWAARLSAISPARDQTTSYSECGAGESAKREFAAEMARLAVQAQPRCTFDPASPFWSFQKCFAGPQAPE